MADLFTFDANGIKFLGFQDLREVIAEKWKETLGQDIDLGHTTPDGHHLDLECRVIRSVEELLQEVISCMNRNTAKGQYLEYLAAFVNIHRENGESDESLRKRMLNADFQSYVTLDGMASHLQDSISTMISVNINDGDVESNEMPPHSFSVTIPGDYTYDGQTIGNSECDNHIAQEIWKCKPAGIMSCGNMYGIAVDITGIEHKVYFIVPQNVQIDLSIDITTYSEEKFPSTGISDIKDAIVEWSLTEFKAGKDVIPQRFVGPIYSVPGIENAVVRIRKHGQTIWNTSPIRVDSYTMAVITSDNISVRVV